MNRAACLALIFSGLLAYFNAIRHPFVHDDIVFILKNPHIADLNHWTEAFNLPQTSDVLNTYYRPVLEVLYRLEYHFFGPHPWGFHLVNIIIHIINGLLLFGVLLKLGLSRNLAWVVALLFLIHPVQTEAVCCIAGISNLMMALGVLLALNAYLNQWYLMSLLFFVIAFLSKEQSVLFVPLLMVIDYSRGKKNFRSWIFFSIAAWFLMWLRQLVTSESLFKHIMASPGEFYLRLAAIPRVLEMDLRLILCPYDLHYYRSTDILQSNSLSWGLALIGISVIFYVCKRWPQTRLMLFLGLGWFLAALLPVLNIVPLINEYSFILTPEHFLYLPIVGILIVLVAGADYFLKHYKNWLLGFIVATCLLLTWNQNTFWNGEIALFERMLIFEPNFGRGQLLLAKAYYFNGQPKQADGHFKKAFLIMSNYVKKTTNVAAQKFYLVYVKEILFDWAQNDSAMGYWARALDKDMLAVVVAGEDAALYNNMAYVYVHLGDRKNAYQSLKQSLRIDPNFAQARRNLEVLGTP